MQESIPDYYKILGVPPTASDKEIREAFLALQKKYHPDVYKGADAHERTKEINEAWEWLRTAQRKAMYDAYYHQTNWRDELERERKAAQDEINRQQKEAEEHIERLARQRKKEVDEALEDAIRQARQDRASTGSTSYTSSTYTKSQPSGSNSSYRVDPTPQQTVPTSPYKTSDQILRPSFSLTPKTVVILSIVLCVAISACVGVVQALNHSNSAGSGQIPTIASFTADQTHVSVGTTVTFTITLSNPMPNGADASILFNDLDPNYPGTHSTIADLTSSCNGDNGLTCTATASQDYPVTVTYLATIENSQSVLSQSQTIDVTWS